MNAQDGKWLQRWLAAITLLLAVIAVELSVLLSPVQPRASAQIPDSGLQLNQILEAQQRTGSLVADVLQHLRTQTVKVKVAGTDKETKSDTRAARPPAKR